MSKNAFASCLNHHHHQHQHSPNTSLKNPDLVQSMTWFTGRRGRCCSPTLALILLCVLFLGVTAAFGWMVEMASPSASNSNAFVSWRLLEFLPVVIACLLALLLACLGILFRQRRAAPPITTDPPLRSTEEGLKGDGGMVAFEKLVLWRKPNGREEMLTVMDYQPANPPTAHLKA